MMVSDNKSSPKWNGSSGGPSQKFAARAESWADGLAILAHEGVGATGSVFQSIDWLKIWNETIGRVSGWPFMIGVWEVRQGSLAALLPLLLRRSSCLRVIEWADCGVSDYNCPILGASAPRDLDGARAMWKTILDTLPAADIVKFTKMPGALGNRPNPLANLPQAGLCAVHSNALAVPSTWEDYLQSLDRRFRKELRRSWRVFAKENGATFKVIDTQDDARRVFATLESQQRARFGEDEAYLLDRPEIASFYRQMAIKGVADGSAMLTALTYGDEVVATLLGLVERSRYVMVRISTHPTKWRYCSPGRLVIVETMRMLHGRGFDTFDFSIGDYAAKRRVVRFGRPAVAAWGAICGLCPCKKYDAALS